MIKIQIRATELPGLPPPGPDLKEWTDLEHMPDFTSREDAQAWLIWNEAESIEKWGFEFQIIDTTPAQADAATSENVAARVATSGAT
jgi:hypothetical protein